MRNVIFAASLLATMLTTAAATAQPVCGDVNDTGTVTTTDALVVLRKAVGQPVTLTCDQCGSSCPGDPRYLLGEWLFQSDFGGDILESRYNLVAVDEVNCEIVGQDLDDLGFVYAYAGEDYDYVLLDSNPTEDFCDLYVFDYVGPDEVEGFDMLLDLDSFGECDFDAVFDEGDMIGDRVDFFVTAARASRDARESANMTRIQRSASDIRPQFAPLIDRARARYEQRQSR